MRSKHEELFRAEAVRAATSRHGAPVNPIGAASWVLTAFCFALICAVALFLALGRYSRRETVTGSVEPATGAARIMTLRSGVITTVHVVENELVSEGQPLVTISTDAVVRTSPDVTSSLASVLNETNGREAGALRERASAALELYRQEVEDLRARRAGLQTDQAQLLESEALQLERVRLARESLEAAQSLHERQLFATLQLRQREEALLVARQAAEGIRREHSRNAALLRQLQVEEERLAARYRASLAEDSLTTAQFDQRSAERLANQAVVLTAKTSGRVAALQARAGAPVEAGRTLAVVVPESGGLQAELWVPSRAAGFLRRGAPVRLMYDAFPYQKFGVGRGTVTSVARAPTAAADLPFASQTPEPLYRVLVALKEEGMDAYGSRWALAPGMRLRADVVLDERTIWEWALDPVLALRRRG